MRTSYAEPRRAPRRAPLRMLASPLAPLAALALWRALELWLDVVACVALSEGVLWHCLALVPAHAAITRIEFSANHLLSRWLTDDRGRAAWCPSGIGGTRCYPPSSTIRWGMLVLVLDGTTCGTRGPPLTLCLAVDAAGCPVSAVLSWTASCWMWSVLLCRSKVLLPIRFPVAVNP